MAEVRIAHTAWLSPEELPAIRVLLDEAFDGDVTDDDHEHALAVCPRLGGSGADRARLGGDAAAAAARRAGAAHRACPRRRRSARTGVGRDTARP